METPMKQKFISLFLCLLGFGLLFTLTDIWLEKIFHVSSYWVVAAALGYFLGSIPFGLILTKCFTEEDIRQIGSGNIGATNVLRTGKRKLALITLFLDVMKGVLAISTVQYFIPDDSVAPLFAAGGAIIGHCYPVWLTFKGGKAVATAIGVVLTLNPLMGAIAIAVWLLIFFLARYASLSSLLACLTTPITAYMLHDKNLFYFTIFLTALIFIRHHSNIKRLINREESKFGK